jgi:hypothetical protein
MVVKAAKILIPVEIGNWPAASGFNFFVDFKSGFE